MQEFCHYLILQGTYVLDICYSRLTEAINKYLKHMFFEEIKIKQAIFTYHYAAFKDSLQKQIHFNGNILGNKCYRCNYGPLYNVGIVSKDQKKLIISTPHLEATFYGLRRSS